ncbi:hypothetical protein COY07_05170 [Candidatus Peregrinibacteria bacterium CG_4_10_14_0_2_um_filter_43_11]|nr:MAG: hypothetical protein COY07_05170 [Candidatus Peregrinibacteria bacterium CG_4_10_14_0_2_um_filter_43_11]
MDHSELRLIEEQIHGCFSPGILEAARLRLDQVFESWLGSLSVRDLERAHSLADDLCEFADLIDSLRGWYDEAIQGYRHLRGWLDGQVAEHPTAGLFYNKLIINPTLLAHFSITS